MRDFRILLLGGALTLGAAGCPTADEEESFPAEMCEVMAGGAVTERTAEADPASAPELVITEDPDDGQVNRITGLSDGEATHVAFAPDEDAELVLFADVADVVTGVEADDADVTLPDSAPNGECADAIPAHWHLEGLVGGTRYTLALGPTAAIELHLVLAHHEGHVDHE